MNYFAGVEIVVRTAEAVWGAAGELTIIGCGVAVENATGTSSSMNPFTGVPIGMLALVTDGIAGRDRTGCLDPEANVPRRRAAARKRSFVQALLSRT
ncbi:hypothetical protein Q5H91_07600 [Sphingomonas sp. KR1UV-12]|uniref:Uncharacterized protein n=1 Tax=Sphingomonas aurea TaxID=3063994 RepID=A0ABT9EJC4_9SPHN|nr:hypothetical protein [Sphingomonas sp. KR1UV-12]MDP1027072.1 hypothetical protein [Sphingomonas sp. KR1UV-12]